MNPDPDDHRVDAWVRDGAKHSAGLDPAIRPAQGKTLAGSLPSARRGDEGAPSPLITADRMLAPRALPLGWPE